MPDDYEDSASPVGDRDDEEPRRRKSRSKGSNRSLWWILGGAGCLIVLVCGGGIALVVWGVNAFTKEMPAVQGVADSFFEAIKAGNMEVAYSKTSAAYRGQNTPERFAAFINQYETLTKHTTRTMNGFNIFTGTSGKTSRIQMTLQAPNNAMTCTLLLVEEGGVWKVNQISVP